MPAKLNPPFRAEHLGSLPRPAHLIAARQQWEQGKLPREELRKIEDECIREAVARQEGVGLKVVTDGEFRRTWWNHDFMGRLGGVEVREDPGALPFVGSTDVRQIGRAHV